MGASITFDDSLWPLLISRFQGVVSDTQYEEYLSRGLAYLRRGDLYVSVLDMGVLVVPTVVQRQRQAEWLLEHEALMREQLLGCALVITSPFLRLALSAILHFRPLPNPYVVVQDVAEGLRWAATRLEEAGLSDAAGRIRLHFGPHPG
ncbi:hypothetical protein [Archangium lansingense]|uniref:Uncharacterized protein n=1 Tax=Archangium lansingense TaxID=2995310 RepID=A0ABT4ACZ9_9BACT|nr:hypothetical protein [Archangium lansinium]MCY1079548.1 hypothetical protein [Archangium lansinium]